jgi:polyhydroxyalkanoate synthesis repressor PhaR
MTPCRADLLRFAAHAKSPCCSDGPTISRAGFVNHLSRPCQASVHVSIRLYDTESSSYITLDHLSAMTRAGRDFKVLDAKSGDDITHSVLTQIIMEEENRGETMLPVPFLRQLISMYGDQMQGMVPHYLEASMEAFRRNQEQVRSTLTGMLGGAAAGGANPFEAMARQNMAMMKAATDIWAKANPLAAAAAAPQAPEAPAADDLKALKAQLAEVQAKLDKLVKD